MGEGPRFESGGLRIENGLIARPGSVLDASKVVRVAVQEEAGAGCAALLIGAALAPFLIGLAIMAYGVFLMRSKKYKVLVWTSGGALAVGETVLVTEDKDSADACAKAIQEHMGQAE